MLLKITLNLFVRQRWNGDEGKFFYQSFVKPVKVLVAAGHLDVVKLEKGQKLF